MRFETSMILYMDHASVDMKGGKGLSPVGQGRADARSKRPGTYSATGIWAIPRLQRARKGGCVTEALVEGILKEIEALRRADSVTET